jgi:hypothetical protein
MGLIRIDRDQETNARQLSWDVDRSALAELVREPFVHRAPRSYTRREAYGLLFHTIVYPETAIMYHTLKRRDKAEHRWNDECQ